MNRHLLLLTVCQGLFLINNVTFIAINGLVGLELAPHAWMATLPIMGYVVGGALAAPLVAATQIRFGRRGSFQIGLAVALGSALLAALAAQYRLFWLLMAATVVAGYYNANGQLYRFAATELTRPDWHEKAVSLVLAGGLLGAVVGPNLANWTRAVLPVPFVGAYLALSVVALLAMGLMALIRFPSEPANQRHAPQGRPMSQIMRQPVFFVATLGAAIGYGVMNLLMAATPLVMDVHRFEFGHIAAVLQWHVIGMYAPGFFTGHLIRRFGVLSIMGLGVLLMAACIAVALSGTDMSHFMVALTLLGVGWNFLFTSSTALALRAYRPEEKDRAQAAINFWVFVTMAFTAFTSGAVATTSGWAWLNVGALPALLLVALTLLWLHLWQRKQPDRGLPA
ncbi:MFS transporter [uncultured Castellaniella sp.]|uniref:MFS transporter n=1 Tax=uncultured Castellaniella sp. TaxID=647907 RepID=UPI002608E307|nr:MFS transporter [uncultured Castellaniella sp.]